MCVEQGDKEDSSDQCEEIMFNDRAWWHKVVNDMWIGNRYSHNFDWQFYGV